ncbi:DUF4381 domain-containing protein [Bizionia sp. KMM 8389]
MRFYLPHITLMQDPEIAPLELGNIMEPDPIPFTFNTIGWKVLLGVSILILLYGLYRMYLKYKHNKYRRDAIAELESLNSNSQLPELAFISQTVFVLKRTALQSYNREKVASLQGDTWLAFLDSGLSGINFSKYKQDIFNAVYRETFDNPNFNKDEFFKMSLKWIKNHA